MSAVVDSAPTVATTQPSPVVIGPQRIDPSVALFRPWAIDAMAAITAHLVFGL